MGLAGDVLQMNVGQIFQTPFIPDVDLEGHTVIITGANSGLGLQAAKHFYGMNVAHLILACRSVAKGEEAIKTIKEAERKSATPCNIEVWQVDMSKYSSVLAFGDRLQALPRLDTILANAGNNTTHFELAEGNESEITINVISTFLVALLAIPRLRESAAANGKPSHLTVTGSVMHIFAKDKYLSEPAEGQILASLNDESKADMADRYLLTKLMTLIGVRQLAAKLDQASGGGASPPVILNCINPGWCRTELFRTEDGGIGGRVGLQLIGRTAEEGSRCLVHGGVAGPETHGHYVSDCAVKSESTWLRSDEAPPVEKRVWSELEGVLEDIRPGVTHV